MKLLSRKVADVLVVASLFSFCSSYKIDVNCAAFVGGSDIPAAVEEAKAIAEYGRWRMETDNPRLGDIVGQLLGNDRRGRRRFRDIMDGVADAFGPYTGFYTPHDLSDPTVLIRCSADHFQARTINGIPGEYDPDFWEMASLPANQRFCEMAPDGSFTSAFTYTTGLSRTPNPFVTQGPSHVIVLCDLYLGQPMTRTAVIGAQWKQRMWSGLSFEVFHEYISPTLLHESIHVMDNGLGGHLSSGRKEAYGWNEIRVLSNADKQSNADSHSYMATALWMKYHTIGASGSFGKRHSVNNRPGNSPNDGHPH